MSDRITAEIATSYNKTSSYDTTPELKIDIHTLEGKMGLDVIDDGNGYLNAGDLLVGQSSYGEKYTYTLTDSDFSNYKSLESVLNRFASDFRDNNVIDIIYDEQNSQYFISSASRYDSSVVVVVQVNAQHDSAIIYKGSNPQPMASYILGSIPSSYLRGSPPSSNRSQTLTLSEMPNYRTTSQNNSSCWSKSLTEPQQIECLKNEKFRTETEQKLADLNSQEEKARVAIRSAIIFQRLTPEMIQNYITLQTQIDILKAQLAQAN